MVAYATETDIQMKGMMGKRYSLFLDLDHAQRFEELARDHDLSFNALLKRFIDEFRPRQAQTLVAPGPFSLATSPNPPELDPPLDAPSDDEIV